MGSGIAQIAATNGHPVVVADTSRGARARRAGVDSAIPRDVEKGGMQRRRRGRDCCGSNGIALIAWPALDAARGVRPRDRSGGGDARPVKRDCSSGSSGGGGRLRPGDQHVVAASGGDRGRVCAFRARAGRALLQSGAGHGAGGDRSRAGDLARRNGADAGAGRSLGKDHGARASTRRASSSIGSRGRSTARGSASMRRHRRPSDH